MSEYAKLEVGGLTFIAQSRDDAVLASVIAANANLGQMVMDAMGKNPMFAAVIVKALQNTTALTLVQRTNLVALLLAAREVWEKEQRELDPGEALKAAEYVAEALPQTISAIGAGFTAALIEREGLLDSETAGPALSDAMERTLIQKVKAGLAKRKVEGNGGLN